MGPKDFGSEMENRGGNGRKALALLQRNIPFLRLLAKILLRRHAAKSGYTAPIIHRLIDVYVKVI
jgi:hypothetical protein